MTWAEIQLASIRKMFLNTTKLTKEDLPDLRNDKKYMTYLDAMPDAANEGIMIMLTRGKPKIAQVILNKSSVNTEFAIEGYSCFELPELLDNYLELDRVFVNGGDYQGYVLRDNRYLYLDNSLIKEYNIIVSYKTYPDRITSKTSDNTTIDLPLDMVSILPLYIASELYKDDDYQQSVMFKNEFETELANMRREKTDISFTSVNGWL